MKASEAPVPRGSASKKRRISNEDDDSSRKSSKENGTSSTLLDGEDYLQRPVQTPARPNVALEMQDTIVVYSPQVPLQQATGTPVNPVDSGVRPSTNEGNGPPLDPTSPIPPTETVVTSIENHVEDTMDGVVDEQEMVAHSPKVTKERTPGEILDGSNEVSDTRTSPLAIEKRSASPPTHDQITGRSWPFATPTMPQAPRTASTGPKASQTSRASNRKSSTPKSATANPSRRDSKGTIKAEPNHGDDKASLALALQLQMEEHGLRRRSK